MVVDLDSIVLLFCHVKLRFEKKQDNFWRPGDGEGTSKQTSSSTNKVIRFFIKCTAQLFIWFADHCKNQVGGKSSMKNRDRYVKVQRRNIDPIPGKGLNDSSV